MKICMYNVTTAYKIGGIETFYWEVSHELQKREIEVEVEIICGNGTYVKYNHIKIKQFNFMPRIKIINLGNRFRKWGERISFFINAYSYIKKQTYDIFLIHKPLDFFVCYFIKKIEPRTKTVFISGGEDFYGFDKYFARYIDFMFAVSHDNAKKISQRYQRNVEIIPNGVDTDKFKPNYEQRHILRNTYGVTHQKVLMSVGRVVGLKGFQLTIQALHNLPDFYYIIIGDGDYLKNLKQLAQELNVESRILFLGEIDNESLPKFLNIGDIFIQPSIGNEAFGITIIEAMACGIPVIASQNGGIVDIVEEDKNGYLFEINNKDEMVAKIYQCFLKKDELSVNAIKRAHDFTWESSVEKLLTYIKTSE